MKEVKIDPDDEIPKDHDMIESQEPPHLTISHKRNPYWERELIQDAEKYGAPEGTMRQRNKPKPFSSYMALMCVIARFASPHAILHIRHFSISLCRLEVQFLQIPELKIYFFHIYVPCILYNMCIHAGCTTTTHVHREMCPKLKNGVGFPCHVTRSMILGLPYTQNVLTRPFSST
jgi:hypothetical protein